MLLLRRLIAPRRAQLFQLLGRARPVVLEQPRERTIGEQPALVLATRAVVGLVLRVDDLLHGRAAARAGLAVAAVHCHPLAERGHLLREAVAHLSPEAVRPLDERRARGLVERRELERGE